MKTIWGLFILFLLLFVTPTLAQEATLVTETPTATPLPVTLYVLVERDWLVVYVAAVEPLWLHGLGLRTQAGTKAFTADFDVLTLTNEFAVPKACFVYRLAGSNLGLPSVCSQTDRIFQREVPRADAFWYDFTLLQPRAIAIVGEGAPPVTGAICPANLPECQVTWLIPPTPTPTPTDTPTLSPTPTLGPTAVPTATLPVGSLPMLALSARCDGNSAKFFISNNGASLTFDVPWNGFINGHYYTSGTIRPMIGGLKGFKFWQFDSVDGAETAIELTPTNGVVFENDGKVSITCPPSAGGNIAPTATVANGAVGYPCAATVKNDSGNVTIMNIVRSEPVYAAAPITSVRLGQPVTVLAAALEGSRTHWYQIADQNQKVLGYVLEDYLDLSATCPQ